RPRPRPRRAPGAAPGVRRRRGGCARGGGGRGGEDGAARAPEGGLAPGCRGAARRVWWVWVHQRGLLTRRGLCRTSGSCRCLLRGGRGGGARGFGRRWKGRGSDVVA